MTASLRHWRNRFTKRFSSEADAKFLEHHFEISHLPGRCHFGRPAQRCETSDATFSAPSICDRFDWDGSGRLGVCRADLAGHVGS